MLIGRGSAGDGAADIRRGSRREAQVFVAKETDKCTAMVGGEVGGGELGKQVVQYIADSAATCNMAPAPTVEPTTENVANP